MRRIIILCLFLTLTGLFQKNSYGQNILDPSIRYYEEAAEANAAPAPYPQEGCPTRCEVPGCYPSAPARGLDAGLNLAAIAFPFIVVAGVAAIILTTGEGFNAHSH